MRISDWSSDVFRSSVLGTAKHAVARSMDLHRIVALQTYLAAQVSQTLRCVSVGFRNVKIRYLMHAPLSHGENALDKGRGDHIMATVRSISEIGRASWRERGCQYVELSVVAVSYKKK